MALALLTAWLTLGPISARALAQEVPPAPDPVPVTLDGSHTALLLLDLSEQTCAPQPTCIQGMIPRIASLLSRARAAGVYVIYSVPPSGSPVLPDVAPAPGDPSFVGQAQDRFYNTNLDDMLRSHGITHLILAGWRENGSVLYTSVGATLRGYTVVVADDGTSAARDYDIAIGRYQMLTQLNSNPTNEPLRPDAVTLSRTDLISFQ
ncbi:MAG TPA: isochorismatase family protein [Chloroflexota bacterium]